MPYQLLLSTYRKLPLACLALGLLHAEPLTPTNVLDYRQARLADGDLIRVVDDIKLTGDEIVLLARTGAGRSHIVFVQLSNRSMRSIPLDFKPGSHWLALNGDQVLLPQRSRDVKGKVHDTLITLSRSGSVVAARQLPAPVETILSDGSSLVAIQPHGAPSRLPQLSPPPNQGTAFGRPAATLSPTGEPIVIDCFDGRAVIYDKSVGQVSAQWSIPEELRVVALRKIGSIKGPRALMLNDVAVLSDGHILVNMSAGVKLSEGAEVLKLNRSGQLKERLRLTLPARDEYKNTHNPEGFMHPVMIETRGQSLFVADRKGVIARYVLP